ncbi:low-density lipoprotein receptor-related protein 5-like [Mercenaria mercenaria]|uniref:low-density lipoprotein receptor-related protein 5-like n=1 Tax=Mercenaria mercenaria TaxID=6596 RepID=UPI00234F3688|nr:low-density lipoprotein receptor-related protein 5-like [Mercenaria mercenaria]
MKKVGDRGSVYVGKEDGTFSAQIIQDLHRPRGITLDSEIGYLYICDWGNEPHILRCFMDGTHCDTFIHVHGGHPNMVVIATPLTMETGSENRKTLYWTDSKLDVISYVNMRDDAVIWEKIQLNHSQNTHPVGLVVTDSTIYFTDWNTQYVHNMKKSDVTAVMDIHLDMGSVFGMDHIQKPLQVSQTACSVDNGGCTHLCLVKPEGQHTCLCPGSGKNVSCTVKGKKLPPHSDLMDKLDTKKMKPVSMETKDSILLVVLPVTGVVILLLAVIVIVFCYHRHKQRKQNWMFKFVQYMKSRQSEDAEGLVSDSTMSVADPNFKQFDDIDYPEDQYCLRSYGGRNDYRETSMISNDSAFTEMKDFETYSSIDNL